jgi:hypothetical protein
LHRGLTVAQIAQYFSIDQTEMQALLDRHGYGEALADSEMSGDGASLVY